MNGNVRAFLTGKPRADYLSCNHSWCSYFGTVLRCRRCGAFTNTSAAPGESKPIYPPPKATNEAAS